MKASKCIHIYIYMLNEWFMTPGWEEFPWVGIDALMNVASVFFMGTYLEDQPNLQSGDCSWSLWC